MDPVEWQRTFSLSRIAVGSVRFGRAVERAGAGKACEYGGSAQIDPCDSALTPSANVTASVITGAAGNACRLAFAAGFTVGVAAYKDIAVTDLSAKPAINVLVRSSINLAAGDMQVGVSETAGLGGAPVYQNIPALVAGKWTYLSIPFTGIGTARNAVISYGINGVVDVGAFNLDIDEVWVGETSYGVEGIAKDDVIKRETCPVNNYSYPAGATFLAMNGANRGKLAPGITCVSMQKLYAIPGGELTTTEIVSANRPFYALEDQATAAGQVEVCL